MSTYSDTWGLYPFFRDSKEDLVRAEDYERFAALQPYGKVFHCVSESAGFLVLKYGNQEYHVKPDLYKPVPAPAFAVGEPVKIVSRPNVGAAVHDISWHHQNNAPLYFLTIEGKRSSRRYEAIELSAL